MNSTQEKVYWPELDGIRFFAFLMVFLNHLPLFNVSADASPFLKLFREVIYKLTLWGWTGVELFFVLSGFLITSLLLKERERFQQIDFRQFFIRRVLRIWPLYFLALILGFFVIPLLPISRVHVGDPEWVYRISHYGIPYALFLGNFAQTLAPYFGVTVFDQIWSISIEEQFYVVWGSVLHFIKKIRTLLVGVIILLAVSVATRWGIREMTLSEGHTPFYMFTFSHLDPILLGVFCALPVFGGKNLPEILSATTGFKKWLPFLLFLCLFFGILIFAPPIYDNSPSIVWVFTLVGVSHACILLSSLTLTPVKRFFSLPVFVYLGRISYGLYIYHYLMILLTPLWIPRTLVASHPVIAWGLTAWMAASLTFPVAFLSWHLLEKRFLGLKKNFTRVASGY